jgi:hypothetical protein
MSTFPTDILFNANGSIYTGLYEYREKMPLFCKQMERHYQMPDRLLSKFRIANRRCSPKTLFFFCDLGYIQIILSLLFELTT